MKTKLLTLISVLGFVFTSLNGYADHLHDHLLFSAKLNGAQEVPAVDTDAMGVGGFTINNMRDEMCINIAVNGLSGPITAAHIHAGAMGVNGDPVIDLTSGIVGNQITYSVAGTDLTSDVIAMMIEGNTYLNIHTDANPAGEIRGQIQLETDWSFVADTDGDQTVPMVMTDAQGLGVFNLSQDQSMINYHFIAEGLSGPITAAHLHMGAPGVAGDVIQNLSDDIDGNVIAGSFMPTEDLLNALMDGEVYLNVHTDENPAGEIRGQLHLKRFAFDAMLDGSQEVPVSDATATGVSSVSINPAMDTIWYDVLADGLSGEITAAHFHAAPAGEAGDPVYDISSDIMGSRIKGMITGSDVTDELINQFLTGGLYINIHSDMYPAGEIRGQVYRLIREGYTAILGGDQEVPAIESDGYGAGIVSVDRNQSNAHFMFVVGDLPSALTGAHFHNAAMGENGDVVYNLTPYFSAMGTDDAAYGYWKSDDATPFTATESVMFRNDEIYVNIHTDENPSGEIRGQVKRGAVCYTLLSVNENPKDLIEIATYPNPFANELTVQTTDLKGEITVELMNISGKTVTAPIVSNANGLVKVETTGLEKGIYFVVIKLDNEVVAVDKVTRL